MTPSRALRAARPQDVARWLAAAIVREEEALPATLEGADLRDLRLRLLEDLAGPDDRLAAVRVGLGARLALGWGDGDLLEWALAEALAGVMLWGAG